MSRTRGFVYVATGEFYVAEAAWSAASLRRFNPEPIMLVTNRPVDFPIFDEIRVIPDLRNNVSSKLAMDQNPFDDFVFLDSDTYILGPLTELFELMGAFDVAIPAALGGYHYKLPEVPHSFREMSTNVIAFHRSPAIAKFFDEWRRYFALYEKEMGREWDQRSFRQALYHARDVRPCIVSDEFGLSPYPGGMLCRDARILHGRPREWLLKMAPRINRPDGYRVFWRGYDILYEPRNGPLLAQLRAVWCALNVFARGVVRRLLGRGPAKK
jgi:hypothetical protein